MKRTAIRKATSLLILLGAVGAWACSSPAEPHAEPPTMFITNPLCDDEGCTDLQVLLRIGAYTVPQGPFGLRSLGDIRGRSACLEFPAADRLVVREGDSNGAIIDSTVYMWTPTHPDGVRLTLITGTTVVGFTETFVPGDAPGWNLSFSEDPNGEHVSHTAELTPAERCEPR